MAEQVKGRLGENPGKARKAQIAFEFLAIYSLFVVLFIAVLFVTSRQSQQQQAFAEQLFAKEMALRYANEINIASNILGYEKNFTFPRTLRGAVYGLSVSNGLLVVNYTTVAEITVFYPLATTNVRINGIDTAASRGDIDASKGWMYLQNQNGQVVITQ
jgi:hypothetical protein